MTVDPPDQAGSSRPTGQDIGGPDKRWWPGFACLAPSLSVPGRNKGDEHSDLGRTSVPYSYKATRLMSAKDGDDDIGRGYCVRAFPFVGPRRPPQTVGCADFDRWEDSFAYCAGNQVIVGRCSDTDPDTWVPIHTWVIEPRTESEEVDQFYALDWTIDPFTLQPLILVGGVQAVVYVLDCGTLGIRRILRGHGGDISSLAAHPTRFHIFASGANDASIRIWNIFGSDPEVEKKGGPMKSENYGQARADEGTVLVAVLAGRPMGGHADEVTGLAWHPLHSALASVSFDHSLKIWPIPPLPDANQAEASRRASWSLRHRAAVVHTPMFSTDRTTLSLNSDVAWISADVLLVIGVRKSVMIRWLGYLRYFDRRREGWLMERIDHIQTSDWDNSGSFEIIRKFRTSALTPCLKMGYHPRFTPTATERADINLVTDHLFVVPKLHQEDEVAQNKATLSLFAIGLTPPNKPPRLDTRQRKGFTQPPRKPHVIERGRNGREVIVIRDDESDDGSGAGMDIDDDDTAPGAGDHYADDDAWLSDATETDDEYDGPPYRWELEVNAGKIMQARGKHLVPDIKQSLTEVESWYQGCAISPRGAKWIVAVGDYESITIWRRRDA